MTWVTVYSCLSEALSIHSRRSGQYTILDCMAMGRAIYHSVWFLDWRLGSSG